MGFFNLFGNSRKIKNACLQALKERRMESASFHISTLRRLLGMMCNLHKEEYNDEITRCHELSRKALFYATEDVVNGTILILEGTLDLPDKIYLAKKSEVASAIISDDSLYNAVCNSITQSFGEYMQSLTEYDLQPLPLRYIHNMLSDMIKK